jgi:uncharacterized protein YbjT (DUF2867 family)
LSKTAIVIGATGLVGAQVVAQLIEAAHISKVVTLTRRALRQSEQHDSAKLENHVVDFDRLADFASLFKGDIMFSCLGTTLKQAGSIQAQRVVDLDYQYQAAKLAAQQGVDHLLLVSSSGADSKSFSPYLKMKGELEDKIQALTFSQISIFQPSLLLGNRHSSGAAEDIASKVLPLICKVPGLRRYRPIYAAEVAEKMVAESTRPQSGIHKFRLDEVFPD